MARAVFAVEVKFRSHDRAQRPGVSDVENRMPWASVFLLQEFTLLTGLGFKGSATLEITVKPSCLEDPAGSPLLLLPTYHLIVCCFVCVEQGKWLAIRLLVHRLTERWNSNTLPPRKS